MPLGPNFPITRLKYLSARQSLYGIHFKHLLIYSKLIVSLNFEVSLDSNCCNRYTAYRYWILALPDSSRVVNLLIIAYHIIENSPGCSLIYSCPNWVFCFVFENCKRFSTYYIVPHTSTHAIGTYYTTVE